MPEIGELYEELSIDSFLSALLALGGGTTINQALFFCASKNHTITPDLVKVEFSNIWILKTSRTTLDLNMFDFLSTVHYSEEAPCIRENILLV